jgi:hypothetical protein
MTIDEATQRGLAPGMHVILHLRSGRDVDGVIESVRPDGFVEIGGQRYAFADIDTLELIVTPPAGLE